MRKSSKIIIVSLALLMFLSGCNNQRIDTTNSSSNSGIFKDEDYSRIDKQNNTDLELDVYKQVCVKMKIRDDIDPNKIIVNEDQDADELVQYMDFSYIDVKVDAVTCDKEKVNSINCEQLPYINSPYASALREDMTLSNGYVWVEVDITLSGEKSYENIYVSNFKLCYIVGDNEYKEEIAYQNSMINPENPNDLGLTSYSAGEEKQIKLCYIVRDDILDSKNINLKAAFADFGELNIDGRLTPLFKISDGLS